MVYRALRVFSGFIGFRGLGFAGQTLTALNSVLNRSHSNNPKHVYQNAQE